MTPCFCSPIPWVDQSLAVVLFVDAADADNESQVLLRFDDIVGTGAGQIPVGSKIHSAQLVLASTVNDGQGDGGSFHALLNPMVRILGQLG